jgi:hypothetical protein
MIGANIETMQLALHGKTTLDNHASPRFGGDCAQRGKSHKTPQYQKASWTN